MHVAAAGRVHRHVAAKILSGAEFVRRWTASLQLSPQNQKKARFAHVTVNAVAFYQSQPALFEHDLLHGLKPTLLKRPAPMVPTVRDPHLFNIGTFRSLKKEAVWGINDVDQAKVGSPEADLARMAGHAVLLARELKFSKAQQEKLVKTLATAWLDEVKQVARHKPKGGFLTEKESSGLVRALTHKAGHEKRRDLLKKWAVGDSLKTGGELQKVSAHEERAIREALKEWSTRLPRPSKVDLPLEILDIKRKLGSGGSSYGMDRFFIMVRNADPTKGQVIIEIKNPPPLYGQTKVDVKEIVIAYQALGVAENPLTGHAQMGNEPMMVRELEPEKMRLDTKDFKDNFNALEDMVRQAATVLARAHTHLGRADVLEQWAGNDWREATGRLTTLSSQIANKAALDWAEYRAHP